MNLSQIKNYKPLEKIGTKFCNSIYDCESLLDGSPLQVKILDSELSRHAETVFLFLHHAKLQSKLESDHVYKILDYGRDKQQYFVATERPDRRTLGMLIHNAFPFELSQAVNLIIRIADVLREIHLQGVVHGLLNPGSIYFDVDNRMKIGDFGSHWTVARLLQQADAHACYLTRYLSTEVYFRSKNIDGRADIYSLGAIFMQMLGDGMKSDGSVSTSFKQRRVMLMLPNVLKAYPDNAPKLQSILVKALHYDPNQRYFNVREFIQDLELLRPEFPVTLHESIDIKDHKPNHSG